MEWKTVEKFLLDNAVPKTVLAKLPKINTSEIRILQVNYVNHVWVLKDKFVLCQLNKLNTKEANDLGVLRMALKTELLSSIRKTKALIKVGTFINNCDEPTKDIIDLIFKHSKDFDVKKLQLLNDDQLLESISSISLVEVLETLHKETIGLTLGQIESFYMACRYFFYRGYNIVSKHVQDDIIHKGFQQLKSVNNYYEHCEQLAKYIEEKLHNNSVVKRWALLLLDFIATLASFYNNNIIHFKRNVLLMVTYNPPTKKRKITASITAKRPKIRKIKLTWREKRPPRINTNLHVDMPKKANKARHALLDRRKK